MAEVNEAKKLVGRVPTTRQVEKTGSVRQANFPESSSTDFWYMPKPGEISRKHKEFFNQERRDDHAHRKGDQVLAESSESWEEAAQSAVTEAAKTVHNIENVYISTCRAISRGRQDHKVSHQRQDLFCCKGLKIPKLIILDPAKTADLLLAAFAMRKYEKESLL